MKFFQPYDELSPREHQYVAYNRSRANLLAVVCFTLLNVILALFGDGTYALFSASVPHFIVLTAMLLCGKLSPEWYDGDKSGIEFFDTRYLVFSVIFALLILALFFIFYLLSKNQKSGWLIAALVLFGLDTIGMLLIYGIDPSMILDILFHAWVIYYLISGIVAAKKLKNLPPEEDEEESEKEGVDYLPETVKLKNGKEVEKLGVSLLHGKTSWLRGSSQYIGGALFFYNDRIIFKSTDYRLPHTLVIRYGEISTTKPEKIYGNATGLVIFPSEQEMPPYCFIVSRRHRDAVMSFLDKKILASRTPEQA